MQLGMEDLVNGSLTVLSTKWRLKKQTLSYMVPSLQILHTYSKLLNIICMYVHVHTVFDNMPT